MAGGDGNDRLDGGRGSNTLNGGDGDDQYFVRNGDVINENTGEGTDTVNSLLVDYDLPSNEEVENLVLVEVDPLNPLDPPVAVTGTGNGLANKITGNSLGNILNGSGGNDTLDGEAGIDTLNGGNENDILNGGEGNDTLNGDVGDDLLNGDEGDDKLSGGEGVDTLNGGTGNDSLLGNADNDISNGGEGNDFLEGGDGEDELTGGAGRDRLFGNAGNDTLIGDFGFVGEVDVMWGGAGADTFVLGDGTNIFYDDGDQNTIGNTDYAYIRDFSIVEGDQLQLTGAESDYIFRANSSGATQVLLNEPVSELISIITGVLPANVIGATIFV